MQSVIFSIGGWTVFIVLLEVVMWRLYKRRAVNLDFPERHGTLFHFFTMGRVRLVAIVHTVVLFVVVTAFHLWLW